MLFTRRTLAIQEGRGGPVRAVKLIKRTTMTQIAGDCRCLPYRCCPAGRGNDGELLTSSGLDCMVGGDCGAGVLRLWIMSRGPPLMLLLFVETPTPESLTNQSILKWGINQPVAAFPRFVWGSWCLRRGESDDTRKRPTK